MIIIIKTKKHDLKNEICWLKGTKEDKFFFDQYIFISVEAAVKFRVLRALHNNENSLVEFLPKKIAY